MFRITDRPIDPVGLRQEFYEGGRGAFVTFEGWVRDHNEGRPVEFLEYEVYGPLAEKEGARVLAEAGCRFAVATTVCVHRTGRLAIGDIAVWVGVAAAHRGAAFDACRHIIDELKVRVPIWKKEHYADGTSGWIGVGGAVGGK